MPPSTPASGAVSVVSSGAEPDETAVARVIRREDINRPAVHIPAIPSARPANKLTARTSHRLGPSLGLAGALFASIIETVIHE